MVKLQQQPETQITRTAIRMLSSSKIFKCTGQLLNPRVQRHLVHLSTTQTKITSCLSTEYNRKRTRRQFIAVLLFVASPIRMKWKALRRACIVHLIRTCILVHLTHQQKTQTNSGNSFKYIHFKCLSLHGRSFFPGRSTLLVLQAVFYLKVSSHSIQEKKLHTPETHLSSFTCASTSIYWMQPLHRVRSAAFCIILLQLSS